MRIIVICCLFTISSSQNLESKIRGLISGFKGDLGIYVKHQKSGEELRINSDTIFPTASMIKVPILISLFDRIELGDYSYSQKMEWHADTVNYPYDGQLLWSFKEGQPIHLSEIISLMITYSDNHAALWSQKLAGGGERINRWLDRNGFKSTRMNSRTDGRRSDWERYGWGQTTPYEMAQLISGIAEGKWVSVGASQEMYRVLANIYWR
ncbi:MAG: serine hydrolase, partial [Calditrichaeota bacterium]|nr:serine hydrolase [Calditrichota bacterium]